MKKAKLLSAALWLTSSLCHFSVLALGAKSGKMTPLSTVLTSLNAALSLSIATIQFADYLADAAGGETAGGESGPEIVIDRHSAE